MCAVRFYFSFRSPYSWLAAERAPRSRPIGQRPTPRSPVRGQNATSPSECLASSIEDSCSGATTGSVRYAERCWPSQALRVGPRTSKKRVTASGHPSRSAVAAWGAARVEP
jgi:hypothetical protein